jgi:aminomethyltransferase
VVNAACKQSDLEHLRRHLADRCQVEPLGDRALLALQGPKAGLVLAQIAPETAGMTFMSVARATLAGTPCAVSRSGYTGEDGFEISVAADQAEALARLLLAHPDVSPIGLGARDSLRLEAGLCLYGHDIDTRTTPVEAGLAWAVSAARREGGARAAGFPGARMIARQLSMGASRKRVGLLAKGRIPVREGAALVDGEGKAIGVVTSGGFGPTTGVPVAMGYVETSRAQSGTALRAIVRGQSVPIEIAALPFVPHRYYRG